MTGPSAASVWAGTALIATLVLICSIIAALLYESRQADHRAASQTLANISAVVSHDVARSFELYDLSIKGALDDMRLPAVMALPPDLRRLVLFDRTTSAPFLGPIRVINGAGREILTSGETPEQQSFANRDVFAAHRDRADLGLFIGSPIVSSPDDRGVLALGRRISSPDGGFGGVVVGTIQLAYFQQLFSRMNLGPHSAIALMRDDGTLVMRRPYDPVLVGKVYRTMPMVRRVAISDKGEYQAVSAVDGVERLIHYERIGSLPLVLVVTEAVDEVYAAWWQKAVPFSIVTALCCGVIVALAFAIRRELHRRREAEAALGLLASEDALTGLPNRRRFNEHMRIEWAAAARSGSPLSMLMIDADEFKAFNDAFGHPVGDDALRALSACLRLVAQRPRDLAARFGGEEFAIILPSTSPEGAAGIAEQLQREVRALDIPHPRARAGFFTVSIGVATCVPQAKSQPRSLIASADAALYEAKAGGRNRSVIYGDFERRAA